MNIKSRTIRKSSKTKIAVFTILVTFQSVCLGELKTIKFDSKESSASTKRHQSILNELEIANLYLSGSLETWSVEFFLNETKGLPKEDFEKAQYWYVKSITESKRKTGEAIESLKKSVIKELFNAHELDSKKLRLEVNPLIKYYINEQKLHNLNSSEITSNKVIAQTTSFVENLINESFLDKTKRIAVNFLVKIGVSKQKTILSPQEYINKITYDEESERLKSVLARRKNQYKVNRTKKLESRYGAFEVTTDKMSFNSIPLITDRDFSDDSAFTHLIELRDYDVAILENYGSFLTQDKMICKKASYLLLANKSGADWTVLEESCNGDYKLVPNSYDNTLEITLVDEKNRDGLLLPKKRYLLQNKTLKEVPLRKYEHVFNNVSF